MCSKIWVITRKLSKLGKQVTRGILLFIKWEGVTNIEHRKVLMMLDTCDVGVVCGVDSCNTCLLTVVLTQLPLRLQTPPLGCVVCMTFKWNPLSVQSMFSCFGSLNENCWLL